MCGTSAFAELSAEILRAGKGLRFRAHGVSMQPLVRDGDILLVRPVDKKPVRVGEIVLCSSQPGCIVVHRVIRRLVDTDGYHFTVQGDRVGQPDGVITQAQVYGRLAAIERAGLHIDMDQPLVRLLGWMIILRSRVIPYRDQRLRFATRLVKRLPVFLRYLA